MAAGSKLMGLLVVVWVVCFYRGGGVVMRLIRCLV